MKKLGLLLSIMFWMLLLPVTKVEAAEIVDSGECGDNVTWTLDDEGTLVISGEGPMWDYANNFIPPNITSIANGTFLGCEDLEKIVIPIGVTSIGNEAFAGCASLKEIILPEGISVVSEGMVANCKQLEKINIPSLRTLLVDLLNYGAASQKYANYKTDALVNAALTAEQAAWGTASEPELKNVLNKAYETVENPTVFWKGAGLRLEESVVIRYKFAAEDIDNLSIKIVSESGKTWVIPAEKFVATEGGYYAYFDGLYAMHSSADETLNELLSALMKYGNAAYEYAK